MLGIRGGAGGGAVVVDPSNLHLKKELTQIQKASRALRDPDTISSWRSPLSSARSTGVAAAAASSSSVNYYYHHFGSNSNSLPLAERRNKVTERHSAQLEVDSFNRSDDNGSGGRRDKKVFLYNWRIHKSDSERSASVTARSYDREKLPHHYRRNAAGGGGVDISGGDESVDGSLSDARNDGGGGVDISGGDESVDDSLSDARNDGGGGDSRSDIVDRYASLIFQSKNTKVAPPIRKTSITKKLKKGSQSTLMKKHSRQRQLSLVDHQSDEVEEHHTSADLRQSSATSPLLSRLKSSKLLKNSSRKKDSSYCCGTPASSTGSFSRYRVKNPSNVGSWDATTVSCNDGDNEMDDRLDVSGSQGCGIPCYWSKRTTPKRRGVCGSYYSPSLSDTLRRKGSNILCGTQTMHRRCRPGSSLGSNKKRLVSRTAQGLIPLLTSSADGRGGSSLRTDDEISTNYGELDLEALSRLDGRRWSASCRSQDGLELVAINGEREDGSLTENITSLSQKYRPMFFDELVGQNIVVQSLMNAIQRGRISPIYLFQGPRGTGKTSVARIFASALNCLANEAKPCGVCRECSNINAGKSRGLTEIDGSNIKGIDRVRYVLKSLGVGSKSDFPLYKVIVVDECHLLPSKSWLSFLKFLEESRPKTVLIFVTTDLDNVPRPVLSRCQKYLFNKIKEVDIVTRLRKIAADENLDVELEALDLIAQNADGSLRDAETMLDQLSLLGKSITPSLVNELVGVVSDEKVLELLELAMSSDTAETVKRARELMDSGVDPMVLMSQLATLIMDIIAGTYQVVETTKNSDSFVDGRSLSESELERLKHALKLLSEAEKQLRVSSERSTWFTATLLQLGSLPSPVHTHSGSSRRLSSKNTEDDPSSTFRDTFPQKERPDVYCTPKRDAVGATENDFMVGHTMLNSIKSDVLDEIWVRCIDKCHSKTLRHLLYSYGKLVSVSEVEGLFIAYVAFDNRDIKARAERFLSSITNSFEIVLRHNIEVRIILLSDNVTSPITSKAVFSSHSLDKKRIGTNMEAKAIISRPIDEYSDVDSLQNSLNKSKGSFNDVEGKGILVSVERNVNMNGPTKGRKPVIPVQRIESIIREHRLETAWLQTADKGTPGSLNRLKPERNQVLPQNGIDHSIQQELTDSVNLVSQNWEDELNQELNLLKVNNGKTLEKDQNGKRIDHFPTSPSLLHDNSYVGKLSKENMGYESGTGGGGCSGLFCWNNTRHRRRGKAKPGTPMRSRKGARFSLFGECAKSRRMENRHRR